MKTIVTSGGEGFTADNAKQYGTSLGLIYGGMLAGNVVVKSLKKEEDLLVNGGIALAGMAGAMYAKNPIVKLLCIGAAVSGTMRTVAIGVKKVAEKVQGIDGIEGIVSPEMLAKIQSFIPSLGEVTIENVAGDDENLGEAIGQYTDYENVTEKMAGLGNPSGLGSADAVLVV